MFFQNRIITSIVLKSSPSAFAKATRPHASSKVANNFIFPHFLPQLPVQMANSLENRKQAVIYKSLYFFNRYETVDCVKH